MPFEVPIVNCFRWKFTCPDPLDPCSPDPWIWRLMCALPSPNTHFCIRTCCQSFHTVDLLLRGKISTVARVSGESFVCRAEILRNASGTLASLELPSLESCSAECGRVLSSVREAAERQMRVGRRQTDCFYLSCAGCGRRECVQNQPRKMWNIVGSIVFVLVKFCGPSSTGSLLR